MVSLLKYYSLNKDIKDNMSYINKDFFYFIGSL